MIKKFLTLTLILTLCFCLISVFPDPVYASSNIHSIVGTEHGLYAVYRYDITVDSSFRVCFGISRFNDSLFNCCIYLDGDGPSSLSVHYTRPDGEWDGSISKTGYYLHGVSCYFIGASYYPLVSYTDPIVINFDSPVDSSVLYSDSTMQEVRDYFDIPEQEEIADADLDIINLNCWVVNDQQVTVDAGSSLRNAWNNFCKTIYTELNPSSSISDIIDADTAYMKNGYFKTYIPGVSLTWDSPDIVPDQLVNQHQDYDAPKYKVWIDGRADIDYKTSWDPIINLMNSQKVSSCAFTKLELLDGYIRYNPRVTYLYNTNSGSDKVLNYVADHSSFTKPSDFDYHQCLILNTVVSLVYIQAYKLDSDGNIHSGAVSYVDLSTGIPVVHNGVTNNIDDVPGSDDTGDGVKDTVGQPYTVSGDNIVQGDTITNITNNYYGGLDTGGKNFVQAGLAIILSILEMIKLLFASYLMPFIKIGFTGNPIIGPRL